MVSVRERKSHHMAAARASTFIARFMGLMFRDHHASERALLLSPCRCVHTCFMRFPLDVVFLDQGFRVVAVVENLKPWRLSRYFAQAVHVLELSAGSARRLDLQCGDTVCIF